MRTMNSDDPVLVAGHTGLVGGAITRQLVERGFSRLLLPGHGELDLTNQPDVDAFFATNRPRYVFLAAAKVGGILANDTYPADFLRENLQIQTNIIDAAYRHGTQKLLFLGSSCVYPRLAPQPLKEEYLLSGPLESTNEWYAVAKIAGIKMSQAYWRQHGFHAISAMPTNLYGPGDNFDLRNSHVLPALIRKFHEAKELGQSEVVLWGSGTPRREFLHVDDLADALVFLMDHYESPELINVGTGEDMTIAYLAALVARIVGFTGKLVLDPSKPDGTPRKLLDVSRIHALGWRARIPLEEGIRDTYDWFIRNRSSLRS
jgi:GDP-L-fucose synthase